MEDYDYADLVVENNELRRIIAEMEKVTIIPNEVQSESSKDMEVKEVSTHVKYCPRNIFIFSSKNNSFSSKSRSKSKY